MGGTTWGPFTDEKKPPGTKAAARSAGGEGELGLVAVPLARRRRHL